MSKLLTVIGKDDGVDGYAIECPGCGYHHCFYVRVPPEYQARAATFPVWGFNGNLESPTFQGSMLMRAGDDGPLCHSFVTDGQIQFLGDCAHKLAGQTVDLPEVEA